MYTKVLWFFLAISQLTPSVFGCDYKLLDLMADSHTRNIWSSKNLVSVDTIKRNLIFVNDVEKIDEKYTKSENFDALCGEIKTQIKNEKFLHFFQNCKLIYEDSQTDPVARSATYILLEKVKERFSTQLAFFKRIEKTS